jgi:hypothetical protein
VAPERLELAGGLSQPILALAWEVLKGKPNTSTYRRKSVRSKERNRFCDSRACLPTPGKRGGRWDSVEDIPPDTTHLLGAILSSASPMIPTLSSASYSNISVPRPTHSCFLPTFQASSASPPLYSPHMLNPLSTRLHNHANFPTPSHIWVLLALLHAKNREFGSVGRA